jgi:hypothetical protein
METKKNVSGLAFCEYKDWKHLEGIRTILTRRNAITIAHSPSTALSRWCHYVLMIVQ